MDHWTDEAEKPSWLSLAGLAVCVLAATSLVMFLFYEGSADGPTGSVPVALSLLAG